MRPAGGRDPDPARPARGRAVSPGRLGALLRLRRRAHRRRGGRRVDVRGGRRRRHRIGLSLVPFLEALLELARGPAEVPRDVGQLARAEDTTATTSTIHPQSGISIAPSVEASKSTSPLRNGGRRTARCSRRGAGVSFARHFPFKSGPVRPGRETTRCTTTCAPPRLLEEAFPCEHDPRTPTTSAGRSPGSPTRSSSANGRDRLVARGDRRPRATTSRVRLAREIAQIEGVEVPVGCARHHVLPRRHRPDRRGARGPRDADPLRHRRPDRGPGRRRPVHGQDDPGGDGRPDGPRPARAGSGSPSSSIAGTASCRSVRTSSGRTSPRSSADDVRVMVTEVDGEDGAIVQEAAARTNQGQSPDARQESA